MQNFQKYRDMAFLNERGQEWLVELTRDDFWEEYYRRMFAFIKGHSNYRRKGYYPIGADNPSTVGRVCRETLIGAIYHIGYIGDFRDKKPMVRWANRLRQPTALEQAGGMGEPIPSKRGLILSPWLCPWEMVILDDWLESYVKPSLKPEKKSAGSSWPGELGSGPCSGRPETGAGVGSSSSSSDVNLMELIDKCRR